MNLKSFLIGGAVALGSIIALFSIPGSPASGLLPLECAKCHLPGVLKDGRHSLVKGNVWYRCHLCGERWHESLIARQKQSEQPGCWTALAFELAGVTDSGPVHAGQDLPKAE